MTCIADAVDIMKELTSCLPGWLLLTGPLGSLLPLQSSAASALGV